MITDAHVPSSEAEDEEGKWLAVPRVRTTLDEVLDEVLTLINRPRPESSKHTNFIMIMISVHIHLH